MILPAFRHRGLPFILSSHPSVYKEILMENNHNEQLHCFDISMKYYYCLKILLLEYHSDDLSSLKRPDLGHFQLIFYTYFVYYFLLSLFNELQLNSKKIRPRKAEGSATSGPRLPMYHCSTF